MGTAELVGMITTGAAYINPQIIALVKGDAARKQQAASVLSAIVAVIVALVQMRVWDDPNFSLTTLAAAVFGGVGSKAGGQAMYEARKHGRLGKKTKPDTPTVATTEPVPMPKQQFESGGILDDRQLIGQQQGPEVVVAQHHGSASAFRDAAAWATGDAADALEAERTPETGRWGPFADADEMADGDLFFGALDEAGE